MDRKLLTSTGIIMTIGLLTVGLFGNLTSVTLGVQRARSNLATSPTTVPPFTQADEELLLTPEELAPYAAAALTLTGGDVERLDYPDGSRQLQRTFQRESSQGYLRLTSRVIVEPDEERAEATCTEQWRGLVEGIRSKPSGQLTVESAPDLYSCCESSNMALITSPRREVFGNLFTAREGRACYSLILLGVAVEEERAWEALLGGKLSAMATLSHNASHGVTR